MPPTGHELQTGSARVDDLRRQYELQGYRVLNELPVTESDALAAYKPDLVVQKDDEIIVVELKRGVEARETADLQVLRDQVESHPGWRFRLLLLGDPGQAIPLASRKGVRSDYRRREARARKALKLGHLDEAITILWMAIEGTLRTYFARRGQVPNKGVTALSMLRKLYDEGLIDKIELTLLSEGYKARSEAVHAFKIKLKRSSIEKMFEVYRSLVKRLDERT